MPDSPGFMTPATGRSTGRSAGRSTGRSTGRSAPSSRSGSLSRRPSASAKLPSSHSAPQRGRLHVTLHEAHGLPMADEETGSADPYVTVAVGVHPKPKTSTTLRQTLNPKWEETLSWTGDFDGLCRGPMHLVVYHNDARGNYHRLGDGTQGLQRMRLGLGQRVDHARSQRPARQPDELAAG